MVEQVADVVAVVRTEDRQFKQGMNRVEGEIKETGQRVARAEKQNQREFNQTSAALVGVKRAALGAGVAIGGVALAVVSASNIMQPRVSLLKQRWSLLADEIAKGFSLDEAAEGLADRLTGAERIAEGLRKRGEELGGPLPPIPAALWEQAGEWNGPTFMDHVNMLTQFLESEPLRAPGDGTTRGIDGRGLQFPSASLSQVQFSPAPFPPRPGEFGTPKDVRPEGVIRIVVEGADRDPELRRLLEQYFDERTRQQIGGSFS